MTVDDQASTAGKPPRRMPRMLSRFRRSSDGTAAIEFALLAFPFFLLIFATIEAFIAFAGEQLLENAVDTMARQVRTGQAKNLSEEEFRTKFCAEISLMINCAEKEDPEDQKLYLDVREFASFAAIPTYIPKQSNAQLSDLESSGISPTAPAARRVSISSVPIIAGK